MSMHLEGPWLSLNGRKKGKVKFRNAEEGTTCSRTGCVMERTT
jgi:hypothetical protein